ncbi:MAG: hypothetical protein ACK5MA_02715 [Parachlamydiaceae bacterium]
MRALFKPHYLKILSFLTVVLAWFILVEREAQINSPPLFSSGLYNAYRTEWNAPTSTPTLQDHQQFVERLRRASDPIEIKRIYLNHAVNHLWADYLFDLAPWNGQLSKYLLSTQQQLHEDPKFNGIHEPRLEDQFYYGNLPSKVSEIQGCSLIRIGQPMIYSNGLTRWITTPQPSPEFLQFIQGQKSHLYVNLMKREGEEGPLSRSLEKLGATLPNLLVVTLDKNSDFYHQKEPLQADFKTTFLNKLIDKNGAYSFPDSLSEDELVALILAVQEHFFNGNSPETIDERKDFIELTYIALFDRLVEKYQPQSMNITCKQGIDRGPSLMALWLYSHHAMPDQEIAVQLLAPPLLFHNRASHLSRIERFNSAALRLNTHM